MTAKAFFEIPGGSGSNNCQDGNFLGVDRFTHGCASFAVGLTGLQVLDSLYSVADTTGGIKNK